MANIFSSPLILFRLSHKIMLGEFLLRRTDTFLCTVFVNVCPNVHIARVKKNLTRVIWVQSGEVNKFKYIITVSVSPPIQFVLGSQHTSSSQSTVTFAVAIWDL